jgi:prepilin-type N-terminal cleavage/methylation domain-containing protein
MSTGRKGFTLVELIIVVVLGTLVIAAAMQVLITNQRTYTAQTAQIQSQESTRAAVDLLFGELREISARGGDLVSMSTHSLKVRTMRKFGVVCGVSSSSPPVLTVAKVGDWFAAQDSVFIFADNKTTISSDDDWVDAYVTAVDTTSVTCGSTKAQQLSFGGQSAKFTAPGGDSVRTGAPLRSFVYYTYGLGTWNGKTYLGRLGSTGGGGLLGSSSEKWVPLVGPLKATDGVEFAYLDSIGNVTTNSTQVRQIQVTVRTWSGAVNSVGRVVADSLTGTIYTRN